VGVCVAALDGPVDRDHPCFAGVDLMPIGTLANGQMTTGGRSRHGIHVASVNFGRHDGTVLGLAPGCRGLIVPTVSDEEGKLSQLDRSRAIDQAVEAGANIINVGGGQKVADGQADDLLVRAIQQARDRNVLIVVAAGNDGCACLHAPAAQPEVLAVRAGDVAGCPLALSVWGVELLCGDFTPSNCPSTTRS
jgi:subtilisin family serine protease